MIKLNGEEIIQSVARLKSYYYCRGQDVIGHIYFRHGFRSFYFNIFSIVFNRKVPVSYVIERLRKSICKWYGSFECLVLITCVFVVRFLAL